MSGPPGGRLIATSHRTEQGTDHHAQYLISVWHDEDYTDADWSDPDMARIGQQVGAVNEEMERTGVWVFGAGLQPQSTATVLRADGGDVCWP